MSATDAQRAASARYDRANARHYHLKLNVNTDADLIAYLDAQSSVQGYLKGVVRADMRAVKEDFRMEEHITELIAKGEASVTRLENGGASLSVPDPDVECWLVRRLDATREDGVWIVGPSATPSIDRILYDPLAEAERFSDKGDVISYIEDTLGEFVDDFDVEAIADEVTEWQDGKFVLIVSDDDYWDVVQKHDVSASDELRH